MQQTRWVPRVAALAAMTVLTTVARAADLSLPLWQQKPDISGIITQVPVLRQPMPQGWQPTLFWWPPPLAFDDAAKLKEQLQAFTARGIVVCLDLNADYAEILGPTAAESTAKAIAQAKAVMAAGFPVHFAMKGVLDLYRTPGGKQGKLVCHADAPGKTLRLVAPAAGATYRIDAAGNAQAVE